MKKREAITYIIDAVQQAQKTLANYLEPNDYSADEMTSDLCSVLDNTEIIQVVTKLKKMAKQNQFPKGRERSAMEMLRKLHESGHIKDHKGIEEQVTRILYDPLTQKHEYVNPIDAYWRGFANAKSNGPELKQIEVGSKAYELLQMLFLKRELSTHSKELITQFIHRNPYWPEHEFNQKIHPQPDKFDTLSGEPGNLKTSVTEYTVEGGKVMMGHEVTGDGSGQPLPPISDDQKSIQNRLEGWRYLYEKEKERRKRDNIDWANKYQVVKEQLSTASLVINEIDIEMKLHLHAVKKPFDLLSRYVKVLLNIEYSLRKYQDSSEGPKIKSLLLKGRAKEVLNFTYTIGQTSPIGRIKSIERTNEGKAILLHGIHDGKSHYLTALKGDCSIIEYEKSGENETQHKSSVRTCGDSCPETASCESSANACKMPLSNTGQRQDVASEGLKRSKVTLHQDTSIPCTVDKYGVEFDLNKVKQHLNMLNDSRIRTTGEELEDIYKTFKSIK